MSDLVDMIVRLTNEVADLKRRISQQNRRGRVHRVSEDGNRIQVKFGEDEDGQPILTPWIPVSGGNGSAKTRHAYTEGEHVMTSNPSGDWEGAEVRPSNHHQEGTSPSTTKGEHVIHDGGGVRVAIKDGALTISRGGVTTVFNASGVESTGGMIKHDGKNIGSSHTHGGVEAGSAKTAGPEA